MSSACALFNLVRICGRCSSRIPTTKIGLANNSNRLDPRVYFKPQMLTQCRNLSVSEDPTLNVSEDPTLNVSEDSMLNVSEDPTLNVSDYPAEVEVSYEEFEYVKRLLAQSTVPAVPQHPSYPTPSGWMPPNDKIRSYLPYLVRRTKNHVLPVYPVQSEFWGRILHHDIIKKIEGDIWALESELRHFLQNKNGEDKIITQVHEVSRCIRIRGQHRADIAQFLMDKGM